MNMQVEYAGKRSFKVKVRQHEFVTDLPEKAGGGDTAPTATEIFIGSLAACAGLYAARYLETAKLDPAGLTVGVDWDFHETKKTVGHIYLTVKAPNADLGARKKALLAAAGQCVIHNTMKEYPDMKISVEGRDG
jgi:putative redox protein